MSLPATTREFGSRPIALPWFRMWATEMRASRALARASLEAKGAWIALLSEQWRRGPFKDRADVADFLMIEEDHLGRLWADGLARLLAEDEHGIYSARLEDEYEARWREVVAKKRGGARGGRRSRKVSPQVDEQLSLESIPLADPQGMLKHTPSTSSYSYSSSSSVSASSKVGRPLKVGEPYSDGFERTWKLWLAAKRPGLNKKAAWAKWCARVNAGHPEETLHKNTANYLALKRSMGAVGTGKMFAPETFYGEREHCLCYPEPVQSEEEARREEARREEALKKARREEHEQDRLRRSQREKEAQDRAERDLALRKKTWWDGLSATDRARLDARAASRAKEFSVKGVVADGMVKVARRVVLTEAFEAFERNGKPTEGGMMEEAS